MRNLLLFITITVFLLPSCGKDVPITRGTDEPVNFDCATFFDQGDYSSICFVGNEEMEVDVDVIPGGSTCIVQLGLQAGAVNDYVTVSFFEATVLANIPGVPSVAEGVFQSIKNGALNVENVTNLGNDAFTSRDDVSFQSSVEVQLVVLYSNLILTFDTGYNPQDGPHCANETDELIKLAKIILENLG